MGMMMKLSLFIVGCAIFAKTMAVDRETVQTVDNPVPAGSLESAAGVPDVPADLNAAMDARKQEHEEAKAERDAARQQKQAARLAKQELRSSGADKAAIAAAEEALNAAKAKLDSAKAKAAERKAGKIAAREAKRAVIRQIGALKVEAKKALDAGQAVDPKIKEQIDALRAQLGRRPRDSAGPE